MTSNVVSPRRKNDAEGRQLSPEQAAAAAMVADAKARGLELTGPNGLLKLFTKNVLETALTEEMTEHLGHEKHQAEPGRESTNVRNGSRAKTVVSDAAGEVRIDVPRDRAGTFEPQIVKKRQRRLTDVDEIVLSLYAKGLTTGEISAHFAEIEIRTVICSTNAIESLNARYRRAVRARGHFPTEQAALKCLYLVTRSLDPTGVGRTRWTMRWKPVINAFAITFGDRWPDAETY
jgi:transposase-like protein